jgi:hypothetical protein
MQDATPPGSDAAKWTRHRGKLFEREVFLYHSDRMRQYPAGKLSNFGHPLKLNFVIPVMLVRFAARVPQLEVQLHTRRD